MRQKPGETGRQFWSRFLSKKSEILDGSDAEVMAAFGANIHEEWLFMDLVRHRPRTISELSDLMNRYCAMEDAWLAKEKCQSPNLGSPMVPRKGKRIRHNWKAKHNCSTLANNASKQ